MFTAINALSPQQQQQQQKQHAYITRLSLLIGKHPRVVLRLLAALACAIKL